MVGTGLRGTGTRYLVPGTSTTTSYTHIITFYPNFLIPPAWAFSTVISKSNAVVVVYFSKIGSFKNKNNESIFNISANIAQPYLIYGPLLEEVVGSTVLLVVLHST